MRRKILLRSAILSVVGLLVVGVLFACSRRGPEQAAPQVGSSAAEQTDSAAEGAAGGTTGKTAGASEERAPAAKGEEAVKREARPSEGAAGAEKEQPKAAQTAGPTAEVAAAAPSAPAAPFYPGARVPFSWAHWRGPEQNGISREHGLPATWSPDGENLIWKTDFGCRSTPVVFNNRIYVVNLAAGDPTGAPDIHDQERVMCLDADTGKVLWEKRFNVFHTTIPSNRVGWANLAVDPETGYIYFHGTQGFLICFDPDGNIVWRRSLTEEFGRITGYGGRVHTPVVDEELVIVSFLSIGWGEQSRPVHRYVAFDKRTGDVVWWSAPGGRPLDTTYSTPVVAVINGERLLIAGNADGGVYAMRVRTGEKVWGCMLSKRGINVTPVVEGKYVYIAHSEENLYPADPEDPRLGSVVCIDATGKGDVTKTHIRWRHDGLTVGYASPVLVDGLLYCIDNSGDLHCLSAEDGKQLWEHHLGTVGKGSPVWADGKLYCMEATGNVWILKPSREGVEVLDHEELESRIPNARLEIHASPAVANGRVYLATMESIYCIGLKDTKPSTDPIPAPSPERPVGEDDQVSTVLVYPGELHLYPGDTAKLGVRLFNASGQRLDHEVSVRWSVEGAQATVDADGKLQIANDAAPAAGRVVATAGDAKGQCRLRVLPRLPFEEDFERYEPGTVPPIWVGASGRTVIDVIDGNKVLKKREDNPRSQRATVFIGAPDLSGYTIEADVMGVRVKRQLPDMGVVANRYFLELQGNRQRLAIVTWRAQPRIQHTVPFRWEPGRWYRVKFRVDIVNGKGLLRGKAWPKGEPEPEQWMIEFEDPVPHTEGAPGVYGFAPNITATPGSPVYFDNVRVYPND